MFHVLSPPSDLARWVRLYWWMHGGGGVDRIERIVPDGCCELVLHLCDPVTRIDDSGHRVVQPSGFVFGQLQSAIRLMAPQAVDTFGVRFEPAGVAALWGLDVGALGAREVELSALLPAHRGPPADALRDVTGFAGRAVLVSRWLRGWLPRSERRAARLAALAAARMQGGLWRIDAVAEELGCTRRTLERAFRVNVGLNPAQFRRLRRVDLALGAMRTGRHGLAQIAAAAGYADQAHLSREFRAVVGLSPRCYRLEQQSQTEPQAVAESSAPQSPF